MPHHVASDLHLQCLLITLLRFPGKNGLKGRTQSYGNKLFPLNIDPYFVGRVASLENVPIQFKVVISGKYKNLNKITKI